MRIRRIAGGTLSTLAGLLFMAAEVAGQATALDVWLACRSPEAYAAEEIERVVPKPVPSGHLPIVANGELRRLCHELSVPADLRSWRVVQESWESVFTRKAAIPSVDDIQRISAVSLRKLQQWETYRAGHLAGERWAKLANTKVYFPLGSTEVPKEDSISVRALADAIRQYQAVNPGGRLTIRGTADPTGADSTNMRIAASRAANLKIALVRQGGIDESLLDTSAERVQSDLNSTVVSNRRGVLEVERISTSEYRPLLDKAVGAGSAPDAASFIDGSHSSLRSGAVVTELNGLAVPRLTSPAGPAATASASPATSGNWAVAVADVVLERATQDLGAYLVAEAASLICSDPERKRFFPSSCALVHGGTLYHPTAEMLRTAMAADASVVMKLAFSIGNGGTNPYVSAFATSLVEFGVDMVNGASAAELLPQALTRVGTTVGKDDELSRLFITVGSLAALYNTARIEITSTTPATARQEAVAFSLRALAVNSLDTGEGTLPGFQLLSTRVMPVVSGLEAWDAAVDNVREVRTSPADVRLQAVVEALGAGVDLLVSVVPDHSEDARALSAKVREVVVPARSMLQAYADGDYRQAFFHGLRLYPITGANTPTNQRFVAFALDFASARDEAAMRQSLRQLVGQGGGYQMKRFGPVGDTVTPPRRFTTLNAYVGINAGLESTVGIERIHGQGAAMLGLGLEHGWRIGPADTVRSRSLRPRSFSLFLQVIDLGAVAATRVRDANIPIPEPHITQVFSPGLYGVWSIGRSPLAFGFGAAFSPAARSRIDPVTKDVRNVSGLRLGLFLAGDVPIFP